MFSMPNVLLRNDACQSDAVKQECLMQVYEESSEKSGWRQSHTSVKDKNH